MPLQEVRNLAHETSLAIWQIDEPDEYFYDLLSLSPEEKKITDAMKGRRKTEWLASRWLWQVVTKDTNHGSLVKNEDGKPCIVGSSWHMSISHTHSFTAIITAPFLVGIDIQTRVAKITRIAHRFLSEVELEKVRKSTNPLDLLHIYWGAKESLYKAYGRKKLDFRSHLLVEPFNLEHGFTYGTIAKGRIKKFEIRYELTAPFILVYAIQCT